MFKNVLPKCSMGETETRLSHQPHGLNKTPTSPTLPRTASTNLQPANVVGFSMVTEKESLTFFNVPWYPLPPKPPPISNATAAVAGARFCAIRARIFATGGQQSSELRYPPRPRFPLWPPTLVSLLPSRGRSFPAPCASFPVFLFLGLHLPDVTGLWAGTHSKGDRLI